MKSLLRAIALPALLTLRVHPADATAGTPPPAKPAIAGRASAGTIPQVGLEAALLAAAPTLRPEALHAALAAWTSLREHGELTLDYLSVIDYGLPSTAPRLWVFDLDTARLLYYERVAHGRNTGEDLATVFSNDDGSLMTSLGAFVTGDTYDGKNGYSLRLRGMDEGLNDHAEARAIVMHGAPYVSEEFIQRAGRLGRSWGCPAVRMEIARELIDLVKGQSLLYAWHPSLLPPPTPDAVAASARR
jgi:hypothetical protein